uniref:RING-type domain-containing protein n=1 Tax=Glossina austeni TaxID=7395 RepID=A0A1A9VV00_GLOAU
MDNRNQITRDDVKNSNCSQLLGSVTTDDNACVVCSKNVDIYSIGECDHPVCYECSTRMRVLCQQNECPLGRQVLSKKGEYLHYKLHLKLQFSLQLSSFPLVTNRKVDLLAASNEKYLALTRNNFEDDERLHSDVKLRVYAVCDTFTLRVIGPIFILPDDNLLKTFIVKMIIRSSEDVNLWSFWWIAILPQTNRILYNGYVVSLKRSQFKQNKV